MKQLLSADDCLLLVTGCLNVMMMPLPGQHCRVLVVGCHVHAHPLPVVAAQCHCQQVLLLLLLLPSLPPADPAPH
jgi:hypothetical protein